MVKEVGLSRDGRRNRVRSVFIEKEVLPKRLTCRSRRSQVMGLGLRDSGGVTSEIRR